jgi:hypothetical protein
LEVGWFWNKIWRLDGFGIKLVEVGWFWNKIWRTDGFGINLGGTDGLGIKLGIRIKFDGHEFE